MPGRFFVDENDLALGRRLAEAHPDVRYPGHPDLPEVPRGALDDDWLAVVGQRGLVVITRDQRIRYRTVERRRWVEHSVRGFVLTGRRSQSTAKSFAILQRHWPRMQALIASRPEGPWMHAVTSERIREIPLTDPR